VPLFDFGCTACGNKEEQIVKKWSLPVFCSNCGEQMQRKIGRTNFKLKGGGWFKDGYQKPKDKIDD